MIIDYTVVADVPLPQVTGVAGSSYLDNVSALQVGNGNTTMKVNKNGLWMGSKSSSSAPFSVDMSGHVTASSIDLVGNYVAAGGAAADINANATLLNGIKIVSLSITETQIANDAISTPKLQANSVTANQIAANSVTASKIIAGAVTADKISVSSLSAISANIGTVTAGTISGVTITSSAGGSQRIVLDSGNYLRFYGGGSERSRLRGVSASGAVGILDEIGSFAVTREQGFLAASNTGNTDFFKFYCNSSAQGVIQLPSTNVLRVLSSDGLTNEITYSVSNGFFSNRKGTFNAELSVNGAVTCKSFYLNYGQNAGTIHNAEAIEGYNGMTLRGMGGKVKIDDNNLDMNDKNIDAVTTIYAFNFTNRSDKRLKTNIKKLESTLELINKFRPVTYELKKNLGKKQYGLIAQDVEKIVPDLVFKDDQGIRNIDYIKIIPILIKAVQEMYNLLDKKT